MGEFITIIIIVAVIFVVLYLLSGENILDFLKNLPGGIIKGIEKGVDKAVEIPAKIIGVPTNKNAKFCCDIFTKKQILELAARDHLDYCNTSCKRDSSKCSINSSDFKKVIKNKPIKYKGKIVLDKTIKACDGKVKEGEI